MANDKRYIDMYNNSGRERRRYDPDSDFFRYGNEDFGRENYAGPNRRYRDSGFPGDQGRRWYDESNYRNRDRYNYSGYNPVDRDEDYDRSNYGDRYSDYMERTGRVPNSRNYNSGYNDVNRRYGRDYYDRDRYDDNNNYRSDQERGWWDRTADEVSSWFGDDDAARRRRTDKMQANHRGRGPKGYRRSEERIKEDINDRLSDDPYIDASEIEVQVTGSEVILSGTVNDRSEKRRAEDLAEAVSGVTNVQNQLRIQQTVTTNANNGLKSRSPEYS